MALVNKRQKCIYLMEPHTASRAVAKALMDQGGWGQLGHHHIGIPELTDRRRTQLIQKVHEYDIICTVRNPLDVLVTQYKFSPHSKTVDEAKYLSFFDWVLRGVEADSENITTPMFGLWQGCNKFVYYEHLEEDLSKVFGKQIDVDLNPDHVTKDKEKWEMYYAGPEGGMLIGLLSPFYTDFMRQFGYTLTWSEEGGLFLESISPKVRDQRCQKL